MADTTFTIALTMNVPKVQARNTYFSRLADMVYGKWIKWTTDDAKPVNPRAGVNAEAQVNSPIVAHRELIGADKAGTKLQLPLFREPTQISLHGNQQLSGQESERKINVADVWVNEIRSGEKVKHGRMSAKALAEFGIPETSKKWLGMQWAKQCNFLEIPWALYNGISYSVLEDTAMFAGDSYVAHRSHPNFFTVSSSGSTISRVGSGGTTYPGNSGYETLVGTAINEITTADVLSAATFKALNAEDQIRKIPFLVTKDGMPLRFALVDPYGMAVLRNDADIKAAQNAAFVQNLWKDNPMLTGVPIIYEGWAIFDGGHAVYPLSTSSGSPVYGPTTIADLTSFNDYSSYTKFGMQILGDNALFHALAWDMEWTGEERDHGATKAIGYTLGGGFARGDYWNRDDGSTGQYVVNDGSAILGYYAAKP